VLLDNLMGLCLDALVHFHVSLVLLVDVNEVVCLQHAHEALPLICLL